MVTYFYDHFRNTEFRKIIEILNFYICTLGTMFPLYFENKQTSLKGDQISGYQMHRVRGGTGEKWSKVQTSNCKISTQDKMSNKILENDIAI